MEFDDRDRHVACTQRRMIRPFVLLSVLCGLALGCSTPTEEGPESSADAISHSDAAKQYDFAEELLTDVWASASVNKLGGVQWSVYSVSKGAFIGLVMFATDADRDVKYAVLVSATRAADGRARIAALQLDKSGKRSSPVSTAELKILTSDMTMLSAKLGERTKAMSDTPQDKCVKAVARVTFGLFLGAGLVFVAVPAVVAASFVPALAAFPVLAGSAAGLATSLGIWTASSAIGGGTYDAVDQCGGER